MMDNYDVAFGLMLATGAMVGLSMYEYQRYCEAREWKETLDEEGEYDTGYEVNCEYGNEMYPIHGFIFYDGSVLDVGAYEDHRVINMKKWCEERIVTYHYGEKELNLRVNCGISNDQLITIDYFIDVLKPTTVFIDIYDADDRYMGYLDLEGYECNYDTLHDYIYDALEGKSIKLKR